MNTLLRQGVETVADALQRMLGKSDSPKAQAVLDAIYREEREIADAKRSASIATLADLNAKKMTAFNTYAPRLDAARVLIEEKQQELTDAINASLRINAEYRGVNMTIEHQAHSIEWELRRTASPLIPAFRAELREMITATSEARDSVSEITIAGNYVTQWSNHESISARIEAIFDVLRASDGLELEPLDDVGLQQRFENIRASLPEVQPRPAKYRLGGEAA
jgi:hypothetical protein